MPHLADGDISVIRSRLSKGEQGVDETVDAMMEMAKGEYGARSPKIRALAINIVDAAQVGDKDYYQMIKAIHNWVRDQIRYVKDPVGQETLSYPEETAFNSKAGDCLAAGTRLLTPTGYIAIEDVEPGMTIQGRRGWTKVSKVWDKGVIPVKNYHLDNGGSFTATDDHRCFLLNGGEARAGDLRVGDALLGPAAIELPEKRGDLTEDDCYFIGLFIADGWADGNKACISGKDGFAKEAQKHWVKTYAELQGWRTKWHTRYITVYIPKVHPLYSFFYSGKLAPEKAVPDSVIAEITPMKLKRLVDGLMADSFQPLSSQRAVGAEKKRKSQHRSGVCYSTTSHDLAKQMRLLTRMLGFSVSDSLVVDHGGLGTHPVHRVYPRYYRNKPAKVEEVVEAGTAHCYDIATADQGIYLPDADVVVHNCDDKTILEIAVLGSVGIRAWPVVIGVRPGHYSHVYLDVEVPAGGRPGTKAGEIIHADPIMREWELGREAPADKITQKKTYEHLAGLPGLSGHPMSLGAYASAPSYLDERNVSSVRPARRSPLVDTASRGEILNAPKVEEKNTTELDDMFQAEPMLAMHETPWEQLGPEGPITGAEAAGSVHMLTSRTYEVAAPARKSFKTKYTPVSDFIKGMASDKVMVDKGAEIDPDEDLSDIGTYVDSIMGDILAGDANAKTAAVVGVAIADRALRQRVSAGFIPGMGDLDGKANAAAVARKVTSAKKLINATMTRPILVRAAKALQGLDQARTRPLQRQGFVRKLDAAAVTVDDESLAGLFKSIGKAVKKVTGSALQVVSLPVTATAYAVKGLATVKLLPKAVGGSSSKPSAKPAAAVTSLSTFTGSAATILPAAVKNAAVAALKTNALAGIPAAAQDVALQIGDVVGGNTGYTIIVNGMAVYTGRIATSKMMSLQQLFPAWAASARAQVPGGAYGNTVSTLPGQGVNPLTGQPYQTQQQYDPVTGLPINQPYQQLNPYQSGYAGGYASQPPPSASYYGQPGSPYSAPPVDQFGPQDMGPAQSSQSFTQEVQASGGNAPASWEDEAAEGSAPPQSPDIVDDDAQARPLPRARRARPQREAAPVQDEEEAEGWTYEAEEEAYAPDALDERGSRADTDVAGLGDAGTATGFSLTTLAVAAALAYIAFKK
jgi:hypothetical protein